MGRRRGTVGGARIECAIQAQPKRKRESHFNITGRSRRFSVSLCTFVTLISGILLGEQCYAQTFRDASTQTLDNLCNNAFSNNPTFSGLDGSQFLVTDALATVCLPIRLNAGGGVLSSVGGGRAPGSTGQTAIEQRLQSVREAREEKPTPDANLGVYALSQYAQVLSDAQQLQLPPEPVGPRPDIVIGLGEGLGVFVSAGGSLVSHRNNRFEDGYEAQLPTVTVGSDYSFTDWLTAGLAFNYTNFNGTYDDGGGFNSNTFGPLLYASIRPFDLAFIDVVLEYARHENFNKRRAEAFGLNPGPVSFPTSVGRASGSFSGNQYTGAIGAGYDFPIQQFFIGPRLGLTIDHRQIDSFKEDGNTGLELRYSSLDRTSLQSSFGARAAVVLPMSYGVIMPQVRIDWVHEFMDDARNVQAEFVDSTPSPRFKFQRESPDRNWVNISAGIFSSLANGWQPFVNFSTIQGNKNFVTYGGTAGLRVAF